MFSLDHALLLLEQYKYLLLFPLAVIEGPIITIIAGLLVATGLLNPYLVYVIVVAGDIVGDTVWYLVGRFGHTHISRWLERFFGITREKIDQAKAKIEKRRFRMTALFKLTQGIGFAGLVAAGAVRVSYPLFVLACLSVTLGQVAVYLTLGIFFGSAYQHISNFFDYFALGTVAVGAAALVYLWYHRKK